MTRVLVVSQAVAGHTNPLIPSVQWLRRWGHDVRWVSPSAHLFGLSPWFEPLPVPDRKSELEQVREAGGVAPYRRVLVEGARETVSAIRDLIRDWKPAVVVVENRAYAGAIAAACEGVLAVGVATSLLFVAPPHVQGDLETLVSELTPEVTDLFSEYGLRPVLKNLDWVSPLLNISFTTEELVGTHADLPANTVLLGPTLPIEARGDAPAAVSLGTSERLVYASLGTLHYMQPAVWTSIARAVEGLPVQAVFSAGKLAEALAKAVPTNVIVTSAVAQLDLLRRTSVFVTHGGANSVMESLYFGVPMLILPQMTDQKIQAFFVEAVGAGLCLPRERCDAGTIRAALDTLLSDTRFSHSAMRMSRAYRARDGGRDAAALIVNVADPR